MTEEVYAALDALYEQLPKIECRGLCWNSCGPIDMSDAERQRIRETHDIEIVPFTHVAAEMWDDDSPLHCKALGPLHQCKVYEVRPLICRVWGIADSMRCDHGCTPEGGWMPDDQVMVLLMTAYKIGKHRFNGDEDIMLAMMEDPEVKPLMARFSRGDRNVLPHLGAAIERVKARYI